MRAQVKFYLFCILLDFGSFFGHDDVENVQNVYDVIYVSSQIIATNLNPNANVVFAN